MMLNENSGNLDNIDFDYILRSLQYIKQKAVTSYQKDTPITVVQSANIVDKCDYIIEAISALELLKNGFGE